MTDVTEVSAPQAAAAALPEGMLQDGEVVILLLRPSPMYVPLASPGSLALIGIGTLVLALLAVKAGPWVPWSEGQAYALGAAAIAARLLWLLLDWMGHIYILTDRRVLRRVGVVQVNVFEAPLRNIQHTSVFQTLRERLFGLGTIGFATAGSDTFDAFWSMVRNPFAVHRTITDALERFGRR